MNKPGKDLKKGDKILMAGNPCLIESIEISDIGKQGARKVRLVVLTPSNEKIVLIRPEDYPFETQ